MGDKDKYSKLISKAIELDPDNVDLVFNLGVSSSEEGDMVSAEKYYKQAISMDSSYSNAYMNLAVLVLDKEESIIEEMNKLGTSAADNKKYDELKVTRENLYKEAVPYLAKVLELNPADVEAAKTLMNIYSALGDDVNFKAMKAKVDSMQN
jgi:tetratricopeptide (TPR) repeat protein